MKKLFEDDELSMEECYDTINKDYGYDALDECGDLEEDEQLEESADYKSKQLSEASQSVDTIYTSFDKCKDLVDKAINAVLDIADSLEDILVDATAIGGKIEEIVPSHIETLISKLTSIAENDLQSMKEGSQSSLESLKDLVGSIPYRDLKPETKEEKIAKLSLRPNLANGPQSAALQNRQAQNESVNQPAMLDFNSLRESGFLGAEQERDGYNDFRELNMGLSGGASQMYKSPIEESVALKEDAQPMESTSSPDKLNLSSLHESLGINDNMMSDFANAGSNDDFGNIEVPRI